MIHLTATLLTLGLGALLMSCSPLTLSASVPQSLSRSTQVSQFSSPQSENQNLGQMLPITAQTDIGGEVIDLEVAQTPQQQAMGLMYRTALPDNRGMLFPFSRPRIVGFWMKNCRISLDLIFVRNGVVKYIQLNAPPCQTEPCPTYGSPVPVDQVIELRGGRTQELGLEVGDRIQINDKKH